MAWLTIDLNVQSNKQDIRCNTCATTIAQIKFYALELKLTIWGRLSNISQWLSSLDIINVFSACKATHEMWYFISFFIVIYLFLLALNINCTRENSDLPESNVICNICTYNLHTWLLESGDTTVGYLLIPIIWLDVIKYCDCSHEWAWECIYSCIVIGIWIII